MSRVDPADFRDWLLDALSFYRKRDFFVHLPGTDEVVADVLTPLLLDTGEEGEGTQDIDLATPEFDLSLLSCDPHRALYDQLAFGDALAPGANCYVGVIEFLGKISRGAFRPKNVRESWESRDGPILVEFEHGGRERCITVGVWSQIFDFRVLLQLNTLLWDTPFRFEMVPLDDMLFVTVLKAEEKSDMERLRGLSFMVLDLPRTFHPVHHFTPPHPPFDPTRQVRFLGTINELLDRCVGKLTLDVRGFNVEGRLLYNGDDHQEDLGFIGAYTPSTGTFDGRIEGAIVAGGERRPYQGRWTGTLAPGNRIASGTWRGWFADDSDDGEEPVDKRFLYRGQWSALEEGLVGHSEPYIRRLKAWLRLVWSARSAGEYPWLLPHPGAEHEIEEMPYIEEV